MLDYRFDASGKFQASNVVQAKQEDIDPNKAQYCCAVCHQKITSESTAINVDGEHTHIKINPDGRKFLLRCFSSAMGCRKAGEPTAYFSWFAGYHWQFAQCAQCGAQLGWYFEGVNPFFGLIKEQLVRCDSN
ncbi:cereblon family protein [Kaarinaea lacus]